MEAYCNNRAEPFNELNFTKAQLHCLHFTTVSLCHVEGVADKKIWNSEW